MKYWQETQNFKRKFNMQNEIFKQNIEAQSLLKLMVRAFL